MDTARLEAVDAKAEAALSLAALALMLLEPENRNVIAARVAAIEAEAKAADTTRSELHRIEYELRVLKTVLE